ncbi:MAG TPA: aldo/keto reductase [Usitatibacteraceae bacterium]
MEPLDKKYQKCKDSISSTEQYTSRNIIMKYYLLGKSGLRVSELALGTMTFGTDWGWGSGMDEARRIVDQYLANGGNFVDTANQYTNGSSEKMLGEILGERRERIVLATKFTMNTQPGDPNAGGNHRKSMISSVEASLARMKTDRIDLLYLHMWDGTTPVAEILRAMDDLVRAGKVLYVGISDTPAWQVSRMQAMAEFWGWSPMIAMQMEYNLVERTGERDLVPMAEEMGLGVVAWSPLASGLLTGKYSARDFATPATEWEVKGTRKALVAGHVRPDEAKLAIVDEVKLVAAEIGRSPAQVALAWLRAKTAVTSILLGARTSQQLTDNLGVLETVLSDEQIKRLDDCSAIDLGFPHNLLAGPALQRAVFGDVKIERR